LVGEREKKRRLITGEERGRRKYRRGSYSIPKEPPGRRKKGKESSFAGKEKFSKRRERRWKGEFSRRRKGEGGDLG